VTQHGLEITGSTPKLGLKGLAPSGQDWGLSALAPKREVGLQTRDPAGGQQVQEVRTGLGLPWAVQTPPHPWARPWGMVPPGS